MLNKQYVVGVVWSMGGWVVVVVVVAVVVVVGYTGFTLLSSAELWKLKLLHKAHYFY